MRLRLALLIALSLGWCSPTFVPQPGVLDEKGRLDDFDEVWGVLKTRYAYLADKATDWDCVRATFRPLAQRADTREAFAHALEPMLEALYDGHTHLNVSFPDSWWADPPSLYAEWRDGRPVLVELRGDALRSGLAPGMELVSLDGVSMAQIVAERRPRCLARDDPEARTWALLSALAGQPKRTRRRVEARDAQAVVRTFEFSEERASEADLVSARILPGNLGYVRIRSVGDDDAVPAFDAALETVRNTKALLLDVRDIPGGNTSVTRPMLGRLLTDRRQYCWMAARRGEGLGQRWPEFVEPRGPWTYTGPVVALVNHWTMSAAEGFAIALESMKRGLAVGTRMRGLDAGVDTLWLPNSGIALNYSTQPVYQMNGRSRNDDQPAVLVDLTTADPNDPDPVLAAGIRELTERGSPRWRW
jgi:carboxyl-terminal processing protease